MRAFAVVAAVAVVAAASASARQPLPAQGIAVDAGSGALELRGLDGSLLARLDGYRLEEAVVQVPGLLRLRDGRGRSWILGATGGLRRAGRAMPLARGASLTLGRGTWSVTLRGGRLWRAPNRGGLPLVSSGRDVVSIRGRTLDVRSGRFAALPRGCAAADRAGRRWLLLCGGRSYAPQRLELWAGGRRRLLSARPLPGVGHWVAAALSPDRTRVLAQWSAECEVPVAFLGGTGGGGLRAVAAHGRDVPTSVALGWTGAGRAVVALPEGACGGSVARPGVYLVGGDGQATLAVPVRGIRARALLWSR